MFTQRDVILLSFLHERAHGMFMWRHIVTSSSAQVLLLPTPVTSHCYVILSITIATTNACDITLLHHRKHTHCYYLHLWRHCITSSSAQVLLPTTPVTSLYNISASTSIVTLHTCDVTILRHREHKYRYPPPPRTSRCTDTAASWQRWQNYRVLYCNHQQCNRQCSTMRWRPNR